MHPILFITVRCQQYFNHHTNVSTKIQKTTLEEERSTLIANLEMTAANYNSALDIVKDSNGDKQSVIEAHCRNYIT